jgi:hypothetical protein
MDVTIDLGMYALGKETMEMSLNKNRCHTTVHGQTKKS